MLVLMRTNNLIKSLLSFYAIMRNSTSEYELSYRIKPLVKPYNIKIYVFDCIHEFLRIIMIISGYLGIHCFFASIGFRLTGQLTILKCKVKNVFNITDGPRQGIRKIILGHHRSIRKIYGLKSLSLISNGTNAWNAMKYQKRVYLKILNFFLFFVCILLRKAKFEMIVLTLQSSDELHSCDWYELSTMDMKSIWICTMRCSKPLRLTCAKFCILSVRTFIDGNHFTFNIFDSLNIPMFKWVKICHLFISFTDSK
ncbi:odorant receptor 13a-like [Vespula squamosa]|uniref:Odorant receptor 13a-like n=2 Tax=Vespula squamosa TaxID=30214 RepID=A0ABD2BEH4_VESSQ